MLERYKGNPILEPIKDHWWESKLVCNPGVIYRDGKVHLLYTAWGEDNIARIGYARLAKDGVSVEERSKEPVFCPQEWFETNATEDPRVTELEGRIYIVYAVHQYPKDPAKLAISSIRVDDFLNQRWNWAKRALLFREYANQNRNGALLPKRLHPEKKYVILHRPTSYHSKESIWFSYSTNSMNSWIDHELIAEPRDNMWDDAKIGPAGPPIETELGWLLIYHGVRKSDWSYRLGLMLLDFDRPPGQKVLFRSEEPILEPREPYELQGITPNVVFSCGQAVIDDRLFVYYGGADKVVCVATCPWPLPIKMGQ